jgi:hypothetical protein
MDDKAGMQSGRIKEKATSRLRQAGRQESLEGRTHLHKNRMFLKNQNLIFEN